MYHYSTLIWKKIGGFRTIWYRKNPERPSRKKRSIPQSVRRSSPCDSKGGWAATAVLQFVSAPYNAAIRWPEHPSSVGSAIRD